MYKKETSKETLEDKIINSDIQPACGCAPDPIDRVSMLAQIRDYDSFEDDDYLADIGEIKTFLVNFINKQTGITVKTQEILKKCPFCGSVTAPMVMSYHNTIGQKKSDHELDEFVVCCSVTAGGCGATSGVRPTRHGAIEAWDFRGMICYDLENIF